MAERAAWNPPIPAKRSMNRNVTITTYLRGVPDLRKCTTAIVAMNVIAL
jgi:hypothetical protein